MEASQGQGLGRVWIWVGVGIWLENRGRGQGWGCNSGTGLETRVWSGVVEDRVKAGGVQFTLLHALLHKKFTHMISSNNKTPS